MRVREQFSDLSSKLVKTFSKKNILIPTYRYIDNDKSLYIVLRYQKNTELNPIKGQDIYFSITLDEKFPSSFPYVRAICSFSFPSLQNNSNLFPSIMENKKLENKDPFSIVEDIINNIPDFIRKVKNNEDIKNLTIYGDYIIDDIYEINDFLSCDKLDFFRANQVMKDQEIERYIMLTDVFFLLLDPAPDSKNLGKLIFIGNIFNLMNDQEDIDEKTIRLIWDKNNDSNRITLTFRFEKKLKEFKTARENKLKNLSRHYDLNKISWDKNNEKLNFFKISKSFADEN